MRKFEYHFLTDIDLSYSIDLIRLNDYAYKGWRIVSSSQSSSSSKIMHFILEREILSDETIQI